MPAALIALLTISRQPGRRRGRALARPLVGARTVSADAARRSPVDGLRVELDLGRGADRRGRLARPSRAGEVLGLVGESGSRQDDDRARAARLRAPGRPDRRGRGRASPASRSTCAGENAVPGAARPRSSPTCRRIPATALNPALRIGDAVGDMLDAHAADRRGRRPVESALSSVSSCRPTARSCGATRTSSRAASSSGSRSRSALVCEPPLVVSTSRPPASTS